MSRLSSASPTIARTLRLDARAKQAEYLVGPRKSGKTTLLHKQFPNARWFDLLNTDLRTDLTLRPHLLREIVLREKPEVVIVDEVQKVPTLLDEIHWCIENTNSKMVLCSSSARSLKRDLGGILGGRAWRYELFPFTLSELRSPDLTKVMQTGLVPPHYFSQDAEQDLRAYIYDYLDEEIRKESKIRNLPAFTRFLEVAAVMNGELLNYANVGREAGVSPKTVRAYYEVLEETLLAFRLEPWQKAVGRRLIETAKVYYFDVGVVRYLKRIPAPNPRTVEYGNLFETLLMNEIQAYRSYRRKNVTLSFWRTASGLEVDLLVGSLQRVDVAIDFKSAQKVSSNELRGLRALVEECRVEKRYVVCSERYGRTTEDGIEIMPYTEFIESLWSGKVF